MRRVMTTPKSEPASEQRSIWSEYTPYATLQEPWLLGELARRNIQLAVAVTPALAAASVAVLLACRAAGVAVAIWPMLSDAQGRWASAQNAAPYCRFVTELLARYSAHAVLPQALALDLEPPIERIRQLTRSIPFFRPGPREPHPPSVPTPPAGEPAGAQFAALAATAVARGLTVLAAVVPPIVLFPDAAARGWQRLLQTPVDELPLQHVSAMAYTSLLEGYSRGLLRRRDAQALLWTIAQATQARYGARASISVGAVGTGALGDERTYRSPAELVEDVALVRAAGIRHLALFNLDGVLARPPLFAWLDALVATAPATAPPPWTLRADLLWRGLRAVGYLGQL
jgi:hypothetical protein